MRAVIVLLAVVSFSALAQTPGLPGFPSASGSGASATSPYWLDGGAGYLDGGTGYETPQLPIWNPDGGRVTFALKVTTANGVVVNPAIQVIADSVVGGLQISPSIDFDGQGATKYTLGSIYAANQNSGGMYIGLNLNGGGPVAGAQGIGFSTGTAGTGATRIAIITATGTVQAFAAAGLDAFLGTTGAKFHLGAGCCDFLVGDGNSRVSANRDLEAIRDFYVNGKLMISSTAPTISSGFGTTPSITAGTSPEAFRLNVGTGGTASSGVIGLPAASVGWNCFCDDITTSSTTVETCHTTGSTSTSATIANHNNSGAAAPWVASDILAVSCHPY